MTSRTVLVCTVGGSPAPIRSAIRDARPAHVLFIVTAADGGQPGSDAEVPNIIAAAELVPDAWEQLVVPPDDPDAAYTQLAEAMRALRARFPQARLLADYTGGTKSMSAALLAAALEQPGCDIQLMMGRRNDLRAVTHGTERPFRVSPDWLVAGREAERHRRSWTHFGYAEAEKGFDWLLRGIDTDEGAPPEAKQRLRDLRNLSAAFAAWDRFQHVEARTKLAAASERHGGFVEGYLAQLHLLCEDDARGEGARIVDLLQNARRRALRGQYDDAIARLYRLVEWSQQWPLKVRHGILTSKVDWGAIPAEVIAQLPERTRSKRELGLRDGLRLLARLEPKGPAAAFRSHSWPDRKRKDKTCEDRLQDMLDDRNYSILAHGTKPLDQARWDRFHGFVEAAFLPLVLRPELARAGVPSDPPQLPTEPPSSLR